MRYMTVEHGKGTALAVVEGEEAVLVSAIDPSLPKDVGALIAAGADAQRRAAEVAKAATGAQRVAVGSLKPALPVPAPPKIICLGLNYAGHAKEGGHPIPDYPALFLRTVSSLIPAGAPLIRPACSETLDYEAELVIVIGKRGRHIAEEDALDYVFGYTILNDGSVREYQRKSNQWTAGKNFDATGPVGPVVVTPDELPAGASGLRISSHLNGQVMQDSNTADMIFSVPQTIALLSEIWTLEPGDLIAMGTPQGVGHARQPQVWMKHGDTIVIEIEGIGRLENPVVDEAAPAQAAAE